MRNSSPCAAKRVQTTTVVAPADRRRVPSRAQCGGQSEHDTEVERHQRAVRSRSDCTPGTHDGPATDNIPPRHSRECSSVNRHHPDRPPIGSGIELEVHQPHPVGRPSRIALLRATMIGLTQVRAIVYSSVMFENRRWLARTDEHRGAGYPLIAPSFRESMSRRETSLMLKPVPQVRIPGAPRRWVFLSEPGYIRAITGAGVVFAWDEFPAYGGVVGRTDELFWVMSRPVRMGSFRSWSASNRAAQTADGKRRRLGDHPDCTDLRRSPGSGWAGERCVDRSRVASNLPSAGTGTAETTRRPYCQCEYEVCWPFATGDCIALEHCH